MKLFARLTALMSCSAAGFLAAAEPPNTLPRDAQQQLIDQLGSDDIQLRDNALKTLKQQGASIIEPTLQVALGDQLEASIRAILILEALDESTEPTVFDPAEKALRRVTTEGRPAIARRAQEALDRHVSYRTVRAAREIRRLKGQIGNLPDWRGRVEVNDDSVPQLGLIDRNWNGGAEGLEQFARIDTIRALYLLKGHPVSTEDLKEFSRNHPQINFVERGAAFLGVGTANGFIGCEIGTVVPGQAADRAGIVPHDLVVQIGDYEIHSADDLIRAVGEYQPGEQVRFIILRDEQYIYRRLFFMWFNAQDQFPRLFPMMVLQSMRQEVTVKMDSWNLIPWNEPSERPKKLGLQ